MEASKTAIRLASSFCLLVLAACGGGGGGGNAALNNPPTNNSGTSSGTNSGSSGTTTPPPPTVSIGAPDNANVTIQGGAAFNFTTNLPPVGTIFGLRGPAVKITSAAVEAANKGTTGTLTFRGLSGTVPIFDLSIPDIGVTATNVRADGSVTAATGSGAVILNIQVRNYSAAGVWSYAVGPGTGVTYLGVAATGWGTPIANVPTTGSAAYTGRTVGYYYVPSGTGTISTGSLNGDFAITVNFTTGGVSGSLSSMVADLATPWNTVALSANINRLTNNASFIGTTSTSGAPADAGKPGFSSAATGGLGGAFFGPNVDEVAGTWTLTEPNSTDGKTAFGEFSAASSGCNSCNGGTTPPTSNVSIGIPGLGIASFNGGTFGSNFTTNPPSVGAAIPLGGGTVAITPTTIANFTTGSISATYRGTVTSGGATYPVFDLSIPSLSLTASNVRGDGTLVTLADGGKVNAGFGTLTYTLLGAWGYIPASGNTAYLGQVVSGYGTPQASVPTSGSATYTGTGGVIGTYAVPSGTNAIAMGTLNGDVSLNVNFASNTANGSFTNMKAQAAGSSTTTPWNSVSLNGALTRSTIGGVLDGSTTTTANTGPAGFSSAANGTFHGMLYGPTAQEVGGMWTLSETAGGGKAAFGTFGATTP